MPEDNIGFSPAEFAAAFQRFLEFVGSQAPPRKTPGPLVSDRLKNFLEAEVPSLAIVQETFPTHDLPNLQIAFDSYLSRPGRSAEQVGVTMQRFSPDAGLSTLLSTSGPGSAVPLGPIAYRSVEIAGGERLRCMTTGLVLILDGDTRLAALQVSGNQFGQGISLEVACRQAGDGEAFLSEMRRLVREHSVHRGHVLTFGGREGIRFHKLPMIERQSIVLPARLLERIERDTLRFAQHAPRLKAAGRHLKRGVLFHGPPGTGKTLTIEYLIGCMKGRTVILLTGNLQGFITQACMLARQLAPSTVVLEDVDLVAGARGLTGMSGPLLFELLNEMDGLSPDADILFLLSTNRPDLIEPALAARPGRIDQAVEFPLPDAESRRRLFDLYGEGLDLRAEDRDEMVRRTEGVSPAFIRELLRKAVLIAAEQSPEASDPPRVTDAHLREALRAILVEGGEMTRSLLGIRREAMDGLSDVAS